MPGIYKLIGTVKNYDWGGYSLVPSLLQIPNEHNTPFAEYWMGTHHSAVSSVQAKQQLVPLNELSGELSFLFKVLEVRNMLSIQVHPSKKAAKNDFERENEKGISMYAANRNYKDENHKPELMIAIDDFWLLHGFKPEEDLLAILTKISELNCLLPIFKQSSYEGLYRFLMELPQHDVNEILEPLLNKISIAYENGELKKSDENFWAARAAKTFNKDGIVDRGIFSIYLFNLLHLKKGQAVFQDAGLPHAYLEGQNVEIMANSDNVLRGGLTTKHVDTKELLKHVRAEATHPQIIDGRKLNEHERIYDNPAVEFDIIEIELKAGEELNMNAGTTEIILLINGSTLVANEQQNVTIAFGQPSAVVLPSTQYKLKGIAEKSIIFKAFSAFVNR